MTALAKTVHFQRGCTQKVLREGATPLPGRVPRVARLMALAIACDALLQTGVVQSLAELAKLGHVSTTRMSHIMNLLLLAP